MLVSTGDQEHQVKEQLVREIAQGRYPVTDPLPSEQKLAARFGVAQGTVRRALDNSLCIAVWQDDMQVGS